MSEWLTEARQRILDAVRAHPDSSATRISELAGVHEMYTRRTLNAMVERGLVHVSGHDDRIRRRKPRLFAPGPSEEPQPRYPYVPKKQQKENLRRYNRDWQRRRAIRAETRAAGPFGAMVAQMRARDKDD